MRYSPSMPLAAMLALAPLATGTAAAAVFTDPSAFSAIYGASTITFEDVAGFGADGTTAVASNRYANVSLPTNALVANPTALPFGTPSNVLLVNEIGADLVLQLANTQAVGLNLALFGGGPVSVSISRDGTVLGTESLTLNDETNFSSFIGFDGFGYITNLTVSLAPGADATSQFLLADNITRVPEPGSFASMTAALLAGATLLRRRSTR